MASDLNHVSLIGRLTRDPELRQMPSGDGVLSMRLAVSSRTKRGDSWEDVPNYFDVTMFGRRADTLAEYLSKGSRVGIDGRLSWREWTDKEGSKRQSVEVIANDLFLLDGKRDAGHGGPAPVPDDVPFAPSRA